MESEVISVPASPVEAGDGDGLGTVEEESEEFLVPGFALDPEDGDAVGSPMKSAARPRPMCVAPIACMEGSSPTASSCKSSTPNVFDSGDSAASDDAGDSGGESEARVGRTQVRPSIAHKIAVLDAVKTATAPSDR